MGIVAVALTALALWGSSAGGANAATYAVPAAPDGPAVVTSHR